MIGNAFVRHLADEERLLLPTLEPALPFGQLQASRLREEHAAQRAQLETLCSWPEEENDLELALRFEGLGVALLDDIAQEERPLLTPELMRELRSHP